MIRCEASMAAVRGRTQEATLESRRPNRWRSQQLRCWEAETLSTHELLELHEPVGKAECLRRRSEPRSRELVG